MNYLELVNAAIKEAGLSLSRLSSADFTSPPQEMQDRFKEWVARAWRELQIGREGWSFMSKRGGGTLYPRILITNGNLPTPPTAGDLFTSVDGDTTFQIVRVTTLNGVWSDGTARAYLDVDTLEGSLTYGETFDRVSSPAGPSAFTYEGRGRWEMEDLAEYFDSMDYESVYLTDNRSGESGYSYKLRFLRWNKWNDAREAEFDNTSRPVEYTETPDRLFDFYPAPDLPYQLQFNYRREITELVNEGDIPDLDPQYHDLLVWMAVMAYGEWDEKPGIYRYAEKHARKWRTRVENKFLPKLGWGYNVFYNC